MRNIRLSFKQLNQNKFFNIFKFSRLDLIKSHFLKGDLQISYYVQYF